MKKLSLLVLSAVAAFSLQAAETTVWEGSETLDWGTQSAKVAAAKFENIQVGDKIVAYGSQTTGADYNSVKFMEEKEDYSWDSFLDTYLTDGKAEWTPTEAEIAVLKARGLFFAGQNATLTKVVLVSTGEAPDNSVLFSGEWNVSGDATDSKKFSYDELQAAGAGAGSDKTFLVMDVERLSDAGYASFMHEGNANNQWSWEQFENPDITEVDGKVKFKLTADVMSAINTYSKNLIVMVSNMKVKKIYVEKGTGIEAVEANDNAAAEYYTLSGVRVNGDNLGAGIYIKRQGKKAIKIAIK